MGNYNSNKKQDPLLTVEDKTTNLHRELNNYIEHKFCHAESILDETFNDSKNNNRQTTCDFITRDIKHYSERLQQLQLVLSSIEKNLKNPCLSKKNK